MCCQGEVLGGWMTHYLTMSIQEAPTTRPKVIADCCRHTLTCATWWHTQITEGTGTCRAAPPGCLQARRQPHNSIYVAAPQGLACWKNTRYTCVLHSSVCGSLHGMRCAHNALT
jgi:hypothetical protein